MHEIAIGIIIAVLFVSLVILFCAILIKLYVKKITDYNKTLYEKEIEYQRQINNTILETQEQAFQDISRELHDDAGQQLTYLNFKIENMKLDFPALENQLTALSETVSRLSSGIRNLSHALNNQVFLNQSFLKAIELDVKRINLLNKIHVSLEVKGHNENALSSSEKIVLYRVFQEITNNALKHSSASEIAISLTFQPGFQMSVSDDGKGFDPEKVKNNPTNGIQNIESRLRMIRFNLKINSEPGKGTIFIVSKNLQKI